MNCPIATKLLFGPGMGCNRRASRPHTIRALRLEYASPMHRKKWPPASGGIFARLYSAGLAAVLVLSSPFWLWKMLRRGKYREGLRERLGDVPERLGLNKPTAAGCIWVHAVSVGELLAVSRLVGQLKERWPQRRIIISTSTATGQQLARERFGSDNVFFFPLDLNSALRPYFEQLGPWLIILAETEIWPNFLRLARQCGAKIAVVNARLSDRSYPRYKFFRRLLQPVLRNIDLFLAQSAEDGRRLVAVGVVPENVQVSGNLKYDADVAGPAAATPLAEQLRGWIPNDTPVIVCGSTMEGEENLLLKALQTIWASHPRTLMVIAPRHPERFEEIASQLAASEIKFWRRTSWSSAERPSPGVFLLDSIGELSSLYSLATLAFVGGSLAPRGGHNILEAAQFGVAILTGPYTYNFRDITRLFQQEDALRVVNTSDLAKVMLELLGDDQERQQLGLRAGAVLASQAGATARTMAALENLMGEEDSRQNTGGHGRLES